MGAHTLALLKGRSERPVRALLALFLVVGVVAAIGSVAFAADEPVNGFIAPSIFTDRVDINGDGQGDGSDDSEDFFGSTHIIDGKLDCDAWGDDLNDGSAGDLGIDGDDDCVLRGFKRSGAVIYIHVVNGLFDTTSATESGTETGILDGFVLPARYGLETASDDLDWRWRIIDGKYDVNGSGAISSSDDELNFLGTTAPDVLDGAVDVDGDGVIEDNDTDDDCNTCFFGYKVDDGLVVTASGPLAPTTTGPAGESGVSGRDTFSKTSAKTSLNKSATANCSSSTDVFGGGYVLVGLDATLAHLTVVSNGPVSGGWKVRVIEATPTSGTWAIKVTAICAEA